MNIGFICPACGVSVPSDNVIRGKPFDTDECFWMFKKEYGNDFCRFVVNLIAKVFVPANVNLKEEELRRIAMQDVTLSGGRVLALKDFDPSLSVILKAVRQTQATTGFLKKPYDGSEDVFYCVKYPYCLFDLATTKHKHVVLGPERKARNEWILDHYFNNTVPPVDFSDGRRKEELIFYVEDGIYTTDELYRKLKKIAPDTEISGG